MSKQHPAPDAAAWHPETLAVRQAMPRSAYGEHSEALFLTSSFVQPDCETAAHHFAHPADGFTYTRTGNPTVASFEQRLAALEGAEAAIATASGMSAVLLLALGLLQAGDHVVCSQSMFGSTIKLMGTDLARFGIRTTFVPQTDLTAWRAAVAPDTRLLLAETPANPLTELCDIAALADIARATGALLAVDNTFATPVLQRPLQLGADLVVHSGTKFIDGQGRAMAGALCGRRALIDDKLAPVVRSAGMVLSPFNAWVMLKGLETMALRVRAQSAQALQLAQWLEQQPQVERVFHPGLPSHPQHELAMRQMHGSGGAVLAFTLRSDSPEDGRARAFHVIDQTRLCSITANLGDVKTTVTHPASTSHGRLTEAQRQAAGVVQSLIRVSVGLEHLDDLQADLARGLSTLP